MCSITWLNTRQGLSICFNRDEQRTRSRALKPQVYSQDGIQAIYPVDPDGGGTWLSVNDLGLTICLLNLYENQSKTKLHQISRGQLVKQLAFIRSNKALSEKLLETDLSVYQPFRLLFISELIQQEYKWNGVELSEFQCNNFSTSSSYETEAVTLHRQQQYLTQQVKTTQQQIHLHQSHKPEKGPFSICMHREDATTVSLSHLSITKKTINFNYWNGSPCQTSHSDEVLMERMHHQ